MTYFASCGHEVDVCDIIDLALKDYTRDFRPSIRYVSMCRVCAGEVPRDELLIDWGEQCTWLDS